MKQNTNSFYILQVSDFHISENSIFNIKLENEYAFIARALEKKVDENGEKMYSKSMIYDWLDKIRKMRLNQSFLTVNDDANDKLP